MALVPGFDINSASNNVLALYKAVRRISSGSSLPSQTGNNGKFLSTDGVDASWITLTGGGNMTTSTYDPTGVSGDAFDYNNFFNTPTIPTPPTLADVLDLGNTSGPNDIVFDTAYGLAFGNSSRLREGTIDAGLGGAKGIAQICAVGYELKWEAGRLYVMDGNGLFIRQSLYNFSTIPTVADDVTKGYAVGSLWTLDNGVTYRCLDATTGSADWSMITLIDAKVSLNAATLLAGGLVDVVEFPAVSGHFWDITDAILNYTYGTVDYDNLTIGIIPENNSPQFDDGSVCTSATTNIFTSFRRNEVSGTREYEANKKIQLEITQSTQGDGTMIVYLTGKLRAI